MGLGCLRERPALAPPTAYRPAYHRPGPLGTLVASDAGIALIYEKSHPKAEDDEVVKDRSNQAVGKNFVQKY